MAGYSIGKGVQVEVKDGKAILIIDLSGDYGLSSTGRTIIVASGTAEVVPGVKVSINAYRQKNGNGK